MKYLAFRHPSDDYAKFVSAACRQLFCRDIYEMSDDELARYEELTSQLVASLTERIDLWLELKGRTRQVRLSITSPIDERFNDWATYQEMEEEGESLFKDRHSTMAVCVLKAAIENNTRGVMNPGAKLVEWVAETELSDLARPNFLRGKKDRADKVRARKIRSEKEGDPSGIRAKELYDADVVNGVTPNLESYASGLGLTPGGASKALGRMGIRLAERRGRPRKKK